jgi:hypothetical protein
MLMPKQRSINCSLHEPDLQRVLLHHPDVALNNKVPVLHVDRDLDVGTLMDQSLALGVNAPSIFQQLPKAHDGL